MKITNKLGLSKAIYKFVDEQPHNAPGEISVTTLLSGICSAILYARHFDELECDVSDMAYTIFGAAVHKCLEQVDDECEHELPVKVKVSNTIVTGRIDCYDPSTKTIIDYKTANCAKYKVGTWDSYRQQVCCYAWLLTQIGKPVEHLEIDVFFKDYTPYLAARDPEAPQTPIIKLTFDWNEAVCTKVDTWVKARVAFYEQQKDLPDAELKPCSEEERWQTPQKFAVMQENKARAIRLYDTKEEAEARVANENEFNTSKNKYYVEFRPGENRRCAAYCAVCKFCKLGGMYVK